MTLLISIILFFLGVIFLIFVISTLAGIPCMPTHRQQVQTMMDMAEIKPGTIMVDLGSGWGTLLFAAAKRGAIATGYEINPLLCLYTYMLILFRGEQKRVHVRWQSLFTADISQADIVTTFLFPKFMKKLEQKLFSEMKPGSKILSYVFSIHTRTPIQKKEGIYVYKIADAT